MATNNYKEMNIYAHKVLGVGGRGVSFGKVWKLCHKNAIKHKNRGCPP
jgi:hypothetical protein